MTTKTESLWSAMKNPTVTAFAVTIVAWLLSAQFIRGFSSFNYNIMFIQDAVFLGIIVIGQAMVIISGGIDLSMSSVVTLSSVVACACVQRGMGSPAAIAAALLVSLLVGLFNGAGIIFLRIPPIIMTMASVSIIEGALLIATHGTPPSGVTDFLLYIANGRAIPRIPNVILLYIVLVAAAVYFMTRTLWGRQIYAIGTNEKAAWLSGVSITGVKFLVYGLASLFAGLAGIMYLGYMGSTYLTVGVIAGTFLIAIIQNVLTVARISPAGKELFQGALILTVILAYGREKVQH